MQDIVKNVLCECFFERPLINRRCESFGASKIPEENLTHIKCENDKKKIGGQGYQN